MCSTYTLRTAGAKWRKQYVIISEAPLAGYLAGIPYMLLGRTCYLAGIPYKLLGWYTVHGDAPGLRTGENK